MAEEVRHCPCCRDGSDLPCCGYGDHSAVMWNPGNGVVQCHNCGEVYAPQTPSIRSVHAIHHAYSEGRRHERESVGARREDVQRLLSDLRFAMIRYGTAYKAGDNEGIRATTTEACEVMDRLGAMASGVVRESGNDPAALYEATPASSEPDEKTSSGVQG